MDLVDGNVPAERLARAQSGARTLGHAAVAERRPHRGGLAGRDRKRKVQPLQQDRRAPLSPVGVRRPTRRSRTLHWGPSAPAQLAARLARRAHGSRFTRESALDGDDEAGLRGLVLLDLPDFDSIERRTARGRPAARLVDLVVWVLDPQKYADKIVTTGTSRSSRTTRDITVVLLNQSDRLAVTDVERRGHRPASAALDARAERCAGAAHVGGRGARDRRPARLLERSVTAGKAALHRSRPT
jgi:hypothetical protein